MRSRGRRIGVLIGTLALAILGRARDAQAAGDRIPTTIILLGGASLLVPAAAGVDTSLDRHAEDGARFILAWPAQIPLSARATDGLGVPQPTWRLVIAPELVLGRQTDARTDDVTHATFRIHAGARAVAHLHASPWGAVVGLGNTLEFWPITRVSLAPEVGLHVGGPPYALLIVRCDYWAEGVDRARLSVFLGYTFF